MVNATITDCEQSKQTTTGSRAHMKKLRTAIESIIQYFRLVHQYWLPVSRGSSRYFSLLVLLLICFITSLLYLFVLASISFANYSIPDIVSKYTPGLVEWINTISRSPLHYLFIAGIFVFPAVFILLAKKISGHFYAWLMLFILLTLSMCVSGVNVIQSYVGRFWQNALQAQDATAFWNNIMFHLLVYVVAMPIVVFYPWVQGRIGIHWRKHLTDFFTNKYFANRAYFEIHSSKSIDNPDQRIAEDIRSFTSTSLSFLLIILGALIDLAAFTFVLLTISKFLTQVLLLYAFGGTIFTVLIGKPLFKINFEQLKREANYRYALVHTRDNAESIAFYHGEESERNTLKSRFANIVDNFNRLIGWQRNLRVFTKYYNYMVVLLPYMILAPMFFAHKIEFGQMFQASFAFGIILDALSVIVVYFNDISSYSAATTRLGSFERVLQNATGIRTEEGHLDQNRVELVASDSYKIENLDLFTPDFKKHLIKELSTGDVSGRRLLVAGPSGSGKSSLIRTIAGLWRCGSGTIKYPDGKNIFFIPQKPYITLGSLKEQILYPDTDRAAEDGSILEMLETVNLQELAGQVKASPELLTSSTVNWNETLSLGEQQRLAFARLIYAKPDYAILDEATSALDVENERLIYTRLKSSSVTYISVGHRPQLAHYHDAVLLLDGHGGWKIITPEEYIRELMA